MAMMLKIFLVMKAKTVFSSDCGTVVNGSFRACSFAMDDGGRCLLDVINDPLLLQSFLESGSDDNSKDPQDGTSSESAVESPQISRHSQVTISNYSTAEHVTELPEQMGYSYPTEGSGLLAHNACSLSAGLNIGMSFVVASSPAGSSTYQHASSSGATIHHIPSSSAQPSLHQPSSLTGHSVTPLSHSIKSPSQGLGSAQNMPPPSPLQQTRSPLPPHTPSPAPSWSPAPPVLSPAANRTQSSMPSVTFQPSHNHVLQPSNNMTHFVQALTQQKLSIQQQQQLLLHSQIPVSQHSQSTRLSAVASPVITTTSAVAVTPSMVQIIPAQSNMPLPVRTSQSSVRPIQPKMPQQILPKPAGASANQFVSPAAKQTGATSSNVPQRTVGVGLPTGTAGQLVIGQGQPGVFAGPQGTIVLNQLIPTVGQSPILIQGNIGNLQGVQLTLRPPTNASSGQAVSSSGAQNNATLIAALQGASQPAQALFTQTKSPIHGQQTIVFPNNITPTGLAPQNLNLTTTAIQNSAIVPSASQSQGFLTRSNIILSPRVMGPNQGLQFQHIQTPQGPILALAPSQAIALPHLQTAIQNATLSGPQLAHGAVPMHSMVAAGQGVISGLSLQSHSPHTALQQQQHQQQSLFTSSAVPFANHLDQTSHQQLVQVPPNIPSHPIASSISSNHQTTVHHLQLQCDESSPKPTTPQKSTEVPSVNLEELLKEHGIVPENTPPPSPDSQSPMSEDPVPTHLTTSSSVTHSPQLIAALQPQHQVVVEQISQSPHPSPMPQLKLALAQDGSVILQPHANFIPAAKIQSSDVNEVSRTNSVVIPGTTAATSSTGTTQLCTSHGHSTLLARLNAAPAVSVPDIVTSFALATGLNNCCATSIITTTNATTTTALIPLTVQSLNSTSTPITSSQLAQPVASFSSVVPNQSSAPDTTVTVTQNRINTVNSVGLNSGSSQNIQNRLNHVIFGLQPLISPVQPHTPGITVQTISKVLPTTVSGSICASKPQTTASNSQQFATEKCEITENCMTATVDISNNSMCGHKLQAVTSGVPNQVLMRLQRGIDDHLSHKNLNCEQQQYLQQLLSAQQKISSPLIKQPRCQRSRSSQPLPQSETEKEKVHSKPASSTQHASSVSQQKPVQISCQQHDQQQNSSKSSNHNIHLVNLLKPSSVHNPSLRLITPSTTAAASCDSSTAISSLTVPSHVRVGNQILAVSPQHHSLQHPLCSMPSDQMQQPQQTLVLRVQPPNQQQSSVSLPSVVQGKTSHPRTPTPSPVSRSLLINKQLALDQSGSLNPDIKTPFVSKTDACKRLLNYHVFNSRVPSVEEIEKADQTFDMVSRHLLDKISKMLNKYQILVLKESMRPCPTPERVMLERLFIQDETRSLEVDKSVVADGKALDLPPPPDYWYMDIYPTSDLQEREDSDHLEAPTIDSCADPMSPQNEGSCDRSPPTLKRISVKSEKHSDVEFDEPVCKKRSKLHSSTIRMESKLDDWGRQNSASNSPHRKTCETELESINDKRVCVRRHNTFSNDNREEDIMTKIRKELNISPLENDDDNESEIPHVDFDPQSGTNGLADFEPPVARTEESCDSSLLAAYNSGTRTNAELKYDFMLECTSEWAEAYANHPSDKTVTESEAAVESILGDQNNPSDLDLSAIEGLDDHLDESQQSIPNGIREDADESRESELNYIGFHISKQKDFGDENAQAKNEHSDGMQDQVQSAIKSILEMRSENRSYFSSDETDLSTRIYELDKRSENLNKQGHATPVVDYDVSLDADIGVTSSESDAALDEAVRSILL